jgi:hypothetical protein
MSTASTTGDGSFTGNNLELKTEVKDLGIFLDSHLTFNKHIQELSSSCISKLGQISRVKHFFDRTTSTKIIETSVLSKVQHQKIQFIQNYAARLIIGLPKYDHISRL